MRVAVLYICTGRYNQFFKGFYESAEKYFLSGIAEKEYFVFTDDMNLCTDKNVHLNYKKHEGFPLDSLFRFDMFLRVKSELSKFDYAYFFNANMLFVAEVGKEFLPQKAEMTAVLHPGYFNKPAWMYPYERNKESLAFIAPHGKNYHYYMGSLNGGTANAFIEFAQECSRRTHADYDKGIIAMVHDESHLNRYMRDVNGEGLSVEYAVPEGWKLPFIPKIVIRDKVKAFPDCADFNKGRDHSLWGKVKKAFGMVKRAIIWYI